MKRALKLGLASLLTAIPIGIGLEIKGIGQVSGNLTKQESQLEEKVENNSNRFIFGSHSSSNDSRLILENLAVGKYKSYFIEGPMDENTASALNEYLGNFAAEYKTDHDENIIGRRDQDYRERLLYTFEKMPYKKVFVDLIIGCAKLGIAPQLFEIYSANEIKEIDRLKFQLNSKLAELDKAEDKEDHIEEFIESLIEYGRSRSKHMIKKIEEFQQIYGKDCKALFFMGLGHKEVGEHFGKENMIILPVSVSHKLYNQIMLKKLENPSYKMTSEEKKKVIEEIAGMSK